MRRAEVLGALSLAIDLGLGQPMEHVLRSSLMATSLAQRMGLDEHRQGVVYYAALVSWIGCHADSHELAHWFGDDIAFRADTYKVDMAGLPFMRLLWRHAGRGGSPLVRGGRAMAFLARARGRLVELIHSHCTSAAALAEHAGLDSHVCQALAYSFERWDGGGLPAGVTGPAIPLEMRIVQLADVAEVHHRLQGREGMLRMTRDRSGTQFDPDVVEAFAGSVDEILDEAPPDATWTAALDRAPDRDQLLRGEELDALLAAMGDFVDLKCPFTAGHSRGVAALAAAAADWCGLPDADVRLVRRAALVHDLGRMGVSNDVWEKPGALTASERERVQLHPYLTGRILHRVHGLEAIAGLASAHHERLDGSGYPHGVDGTSLSLPARLLAAADVYQALREPRPYRPAMSQTGAADALRTEVRASRLDAAAADAVLHAAGHPMRRRTVWPAGLTGREVEVLRLLARGLSNREIARRLVIAEKTVRNHVEHIYAKLGISNRTGATLFAVEHGMVGDEPA